MTSKTFVSGTVIDSAWLNDVDAVAYGIGQSSGSSLIGWIQSLVGSVARWVQDKLRETVSVKDFGAVGDGIADDTTAIKAAISSGVGRIFFPAGVYLCDPIAFGTSGQPSLSTISLFGEGCGYLAALGVTTSNISIIRCRTAGSVFFEVTLAHRFKMDSICIDADGLCATNYKIKSYCTNHEYNLCSFINAAAGGDNVVIGDAVNLQAEMATFKMCFFTNTKSVLHGRNVFITGTNQINNAFKRCRFINSDYHIWMALGCQTTVIELCDFYTYTNNAIVVIGSSTYTIKNNYTESTTGTGFFLENSVTYSSGSQGLALIENNYINTSVGDVTVSPNHQVTVRGNRIGGALNISAPTTANAYYPVDVSGNQYASISDVSSCGRRWNNTDGGVGQDSDAGELIAVSVGQGTAAADTYRKYKRPIQINTGSIYSPSSGNFAVASNMNAGVDNASLAAGYGQSILFGGASGNLTLAASTISAAGTGVVHTTNGVIVDGSNISVRPTADNTITLGRAAFRWSTVYAGTGTINTSDAREKTFVRPLTANEINASKQLSKEIGAYTFLAAIAEKGDAAREHIGMTVQRAIEIMQANALNPFGYGFICYDSWGGVFVEHAAIEVGDSVDGKPATESVAAWTEQIQIAGDRYSFRMDELLTFIARGFEARLSALEQK